MPKPKPWAMRVHLVVPSIRSREVTWAQRSGVRHRKNALQPLDFGNGLLGVHSVSISNISTATVKRDGINEVSASGAGGETSPLVFINTSSTLGPRLIFRMHRRRSRPDRAHQLNSPDGATEVKWTFRFYEGWSFPAENPNMGVWGLLPQQRRNQPGRAPNLNLHHVMRGFASGATDQERLLALGSDLQLHQTRLWRGSHHRHLRLRCIRSDVL